MFRLCYQSTWTLEISYFDHTLYLAGISMTWLVIIKVLNSGPHQQMWQQFLDCKSFCICFRMQLWGERKSQLLQYIVDALEYWCDCCNVLWNVMAAFCLQQSNLLYFFGWKFHPLESQILIVMIKLSYSM